MSEISPLRQLANIISQSVDRIDAELAKAGLKYPSLDQPFNPLSPEEGASMAPAVRESAGFIVAACMQLSAIVNIPVLTLYEAAGGFLVGSGMRVALEGSVTEILRDEPEGMHVNDIAAKNGADPDRLARNLRLLATRHVFKEVKPNVFANNKLSSLLDTSKTVEEIRADPVNKHTGTPGVAALLEHTTDEVMKASAYLTEVLYDPVKKSSEEPQHAPLARAFNTNKTYFDWLEEPGNEHRLKRFSVAMEGSAKINSSDAILAGFKWDSLSPKSLVVDVGGGTGHISMKIAQKNKGLRFVVQDRPHVIEQAKSFWERNMPSALEDGTVTLQAHDFFTPQPQNDVAVFLCQMITHDFPKNKVTLLLKNLRAVSGPQTKLLLVEQIIPYACAEPSTDSQFAAKLNVAPPEPLLAYTGAANPALYLADLQLFNCDLGEERTLGSFEALLGNAGWKIDDIFIVPGSIQKQILASPI